MLPLDTRNRLHIVIGIDPGLSGAVAVLHDGRYIDVIDMPTAGRGKAARQNVNGASLADYLRAQTELAAGANVFAVLELVGSMPGQGASSGFRFGQSYGAVQGVLGALKIPFELVTPQVWKRHYGLIGAPKESSRGIAIERYPQAPLSRKRDHGRAEAILLAAWGSQRQWAA
jgi:crossover junction endodeoxyribonuclease RuvC